MLVLPGWSDHLIGSPEICGVPFRQSWPITEGIANDAGLVGTNPVTIKLKWRERPIQVWHCIIKIKLWGREDSDITDISLYKYFNKKLAYVLKKLFLNKKQPYSNIVFVTIKPNFIYFF